MTDDLVLRKIGLMKKNIEKNNICRFVSPSDEFYDDEITIINFVKETEVSTGDKFVTQAIFRIFIVTEGVGSITTVHSTTPLKRGTLFLTFPAAPFSITDEGGLEYIFISFFGTKAYTLLSKCTTKDKRFIKNGLDWLADIWEKTLTEKNNTTLAAKGLIMLSLSAMDAEEQTDLDSDDNDLAKRIERIINDNYTDKELSLAFIAKKLSYNENYVSGVFKKVFGTSIKSYITDLRINNASRLIASGITSVKEIADFCGYNDALYFSKIFRKKTGMPPSEYIRLNGRKT